METNDPLGLENEDPIFQVFANLLEIKLKPHLIGSISGFLSNEQILSDNAKHDVKMILSQENIISPMHDLAQELLGHIAQKKESLTLTQLLKDLKYLDTNEKPTDLLILELRAFVMKFRSGNNTP